METTTKICKDCKKEMSLDCFYFSKAKGRHWNRCKACYAVYRKPLTASYAQRNPDKIKESNRKQGVKNREKNRAYAKEYHLKNRERGLEERREWYKRQDREKQLQQRRDWYRQNKERHSIARDKYAIENKDRLSAARRKWENERLDTDIDYRLRKTLASRIRAVVKGIYKKDKSVVDLIGCSVEEFKIYIENQFQEGMTWENWCFTGWHIDHKIPLSWFNLENENCRSLAFHYTNMQPLWAAENLDKKNFYSHQINTNA